MGSTAQPERGKAVKCNRRKPEPPAAKIRQPNLLFGTQSLEVKVESLSADIRPGAENPSMTINHPRLPCAANMADSHETDRNRLFDQLASAIGDSPVLQAMRSVPRELFVPPELRQAAYLNTALTIGHGQTISQPTMVARMTLALSLRGDERVLEVGAGSGYQAAILGELLPFGHVIAVERIPALVQTARRNLAACGIANVTVQCATDVLGAPDAGPYDAILVSAAAPSVPDSLIAQLKPAGRLAIPVGSLERQELTLVRLHDKHPVIRQLTQCQFVPLVGPEAWPTVGNPPGV